MSPEEFAQRFGHLFNKWVSLGYCPQCTSDVLAGNATVIPSDLQSSYRQATANMHGSGREVYAVNGAWLTVFFVLTILLLVAGVASVAVEAVASARLPRAQPRNPIWWGQGEGKDGLVELQLPKMYSANAGGQRSTKWGQGLMQDMDAVAVRDRGGVY